MKNILILGLICSVLTVAGQDFNKDLTAAKSAYAAGKLTDARFAMEQMLNDLNIAMGNEILKNLPTSLSSLPYSNSDDKVSSSSGGMTGGLFVHRSFGSYSTK